MEQNVGLRISRRAFISAMCILLGLIIVAGILTQVLPQGSFERIEVDGREQVVAGSYKEITGDKLPIWRWFTAPFEVLASPDSVMAIGIMVFLILIGGTFYILDKSGMLKHIMARMIARYAQSKYRMLAVLVLVFMLLGSTIGIFEETITLVPIAVAISFSMGWDSLVGMGVSAFAVAMGFAAGTFNPFTVGVAQTLAGLPMYSGVWLRALVFVLCYVIFIIFLTRYAKRIEADPSKSLMAREDAEQRMRFSAEVDEKIINDANLRKSVKVFLFLLALVFAYVLAGFFIPSLTDFTLIVMALCFTLAGIAVGIVSKYGKTIWRDFLKGMLGVLPAVLLILLAMGVKQVITAGNIMDTILYALSNLISGANPYTAALMIFLMVLIMNAFIGSGSAKAFLLMPLILPVADLSGVTRQTAVLAFVLGDGFSNMIYPTNAALLVMLGITGTSWPKWFRWTWKMQLLMLIISVAVLSLAVAVNY